MTREDIIRMAKECGNWSGHTVEMNEVGLERFANLIRAAIEQPRQWQDLTGEEIADLITAHVGFPLRLTEAVEAKLKEKNT